MVPVPRGAPGCVRQSQGDRSNHMHRSDRKTVLLSCLVATVWLASCAVRRAPANVTEPPCRAIDSVRDVEWVLRPSEEERSALDAFCWAVGPPAFHTPQQRPPAGPVDSVAVVTWNAHVGAGDLTSLIRDLRSGQLTGAPVRDFVVLLQEVHRAGPRVPDQIPEWTAVGRRSGHDHPDRADIVAVASAEKLELLYAPSMRNGRPDSTRPHEDRGNAILSTLPLNDPILLELPYERQRRIAVIATVRGFNANGTPWALRLASIHLDNRTRFSRVLRSFGAGRADQARALVDALNGTDTPTVIGGDFNSWDNGFASEAVQVVRQSFPMPAEPDDEATLPLPWPLPDLRLDHLFFRVPSDWRADYRVLGDAFGSDHYPLLGWVGIRN